MREGTHAGRVTSDPTHDLDTESGQPAARGGSIRPSGGALGLVVSDSGPREYRAVELLGHGGMGEVHLAKDERVGRDVALKLLLDETDTSAPTLVRFYEEARLQGRLEHPGVVPVYDLDRDRSGRAFFAMKRVVGVTLDAVLRGLAAGDAQLQATHTRHRLLAAFLQACLTVDYAHSRGVVHRDLKPSNLMLGDYGEVYVLDWGIARPAGSYDSGQVPLGVHTPSTSQTQSDVAEGTLGYMAPEQITEPGTVDPRSDIYALGCVLFAMLTRERLHVADSPAGLARSTLEGADARPSARAPQLEIPPELDTICTTATALDPARRYQTARALHDAVEKYLAGDRDTRLRVELAARHLDEAKRILETGVPSVAGRRDALREAGRALALDPTNSEAASVVSMMMLTPPEDLPPDVARETQAMSAREQARTRAVASIGIPGLLALVGLLVWVGVRSWFTVAFLVVPLAVAFLFVRSTRLGDNRVPASLGVAVALSVAVAASSRIVGPLWLPPFFAVAYSAVVISTHGLGRFRLVSVLIVMLGMIAPWALQVAGVLESQYVFRDGSLVLLPAAVDFHPERAELAMGAANLAIVALVTLVLWHFSASDMRARRQLQLMAWHLRQVAPKFESTRRTATETEAARPSRAPEPPAPEPSAPVAPDQLPTRVPRHRASGDGGSENG